MATGLPRNSDVADQFDLLADLLELEGTDAFQVIAYRRAASLIRETPRPIAELALAGRAKELPGIGATIEGKIVQIVDKGEIETLTRHRERVPPDVVTFMKLPGLGPKTVKRIWQELGITTRDELRAAAEQQQLRTLRGLGAEDRGERPQGTRRRSPPARRARCSARRCRRCSRSSRSCASTRPPISSRRRAARAAAARPSATSTSSPPPPTRRRSPST